VVAHPNLYGDVKNMGAIYTDQDVVVDRDLITGRTGAHCHQFARTIIEQLYEQA
jgi:protease I